MIVFFDGVCGLCNRAVDFLIVHDKHSALQFAPLQGPTAFTKLPATDTQNLNSVVVLDGEKIYRKSEAVFRACAELSGGWRLTVTSLRLIPRPLRDFFYDLLASKRYSLFERREICRLPSPEERARFLE
jgi:predicted DCC family thiol-disulfide oxidoreductase YuxK